MEATIIATIETKLKSSHTFEAYIDELFLISRLILLEYLVEDEYIKTIFQKLLQHFDPETLINTQPKYIVRFKYIYAACDKILGTTILQDFDRLATNQELTALDLFYDQVFKATYHIDNQLSIFTKKIEPMFHQLYFVSSEMYSHLDFYSLIYMQTAKKSKILPYLFFRFFESGDPNLLAYQLVAPNFDPQTVAKVQSYLELNLDKLNLASLLLLKRSQEDA